MSRKVSSSSKAVAKPAPGVGRAGRPSPVGSTAEDTSSRRAVHSPEYRAQQAGREGVREIAWLLIKYRMDKGLSQEQLAELVGTSHSQISRIESGRHRTNLDTLSRIAHALDMRMVVGFETTTSGGRTKRDLVAF
jgi:ribosome-binding protein aMBF1 (putative translation factor)